MRIIDKNTDFYDYWQNVYKDDSLVFDRRNSFILTKEMICKKLSIYEDTHWSWRTKKWVTNKYYYVMLQICNTFWLFLITGKDFKDTNGCGKEFKDYDIEILTSWRDFDKPRKLCDFNIISFNYSYSYEEKPDTKKIDRIVNRLKTNDYRDKINLSIYTICTDYKGNYKRETKTIPILKACGIAGCIDAHEVYLAFEEYFSLEKTASERREPLGTTDIDKVESHGFNKKTSFRGKT